MVNLNNNITNINYKQNNRIQTNNPRIYSADQFIDDSKRVEDKRIQGNFFAKNFGSPTATYTGLGFILLGNLGLLIKNCKNKINKNLLLISTAINITGISIWAIIQKYQNKKINQETSKIKELLEEYGSDTSAKLNSQNLCSNTLGAQYNFINGSIEINKNYIHDPIGKLLLKKIMKHEIQHARQIEMITGLDQGIEKLNYAILNNIANYMKQNPRALAEIKIISEDISKDILGKYNNVKIPINGAEVDLKNYIKALEQLINNQYTSFENLPIVIDAEHYKNALEKRGPLSENEKVKAEKYYQALINYPLLTGINLINPFSGYRSNLLEKEARKASRSKNGKINE